MKINMRKTSATDSYGAPKRYGIILGVFLVISVVLEFFVFNYKWIDSKSSEPLSVSPAFITETGKDGETIPALVFDNIDTTVKYIRIAPGLRKGQTAKITVSAIDEANAGYLSAPEHVIAGGVMGSEYLRLHFSGNVKSLKIAFNGFDHDLVDSVFTELNTSVPLMISWIRMLAVFLLMSVIYILRPGSEVYKIKTDLSRKRQKIACFILFLAMAASYIGISTWNTAALGWYKDNANHQQYYNVIDAFKSGRLSYIEEPSDDLKALDNPYDYSERRSKKVKFKWDNAYYDGKYYSYFGIAPAILLYLPYNLITGGNLPNTVALCIFGVLTILGIMLLLWEVIKKWYRNTPFAVYLILSAVIPFASALSYAAYKPDFYMVPPMAALMFSVFGLALWISAEETKLKAWKLCLGAVFIALTAACRPQFLTTIAFGIILFWDHVFKKRTLFSKSGARQTIAICVPFIVIGAAVMWYNYARFGSPFDFGANYNLTSNDMTHRGFVAGRIGLGVFSYFFQPVQFNAVFPFLHDFKCETTYQGLTLAEPMLGGVLMLYPLLFFGIYGAFRCKLFKQDKRVYVLVLAAFILAAVTAVTDAQMAGLLTRYFTDFVWMLMLAATITIFALYEKNIDRPETLKGLRTIILILSYITITLSLLSILAMSDQSIMRHNPYMFYKLQNLISFWS